MTEAAITELTPVVGVKDACAAVGRPRATHYRWHRKSPTPARPARDPKPQPRALTAAERAEVLNVLHEERFVDLAPGEVYAILLDEGRYLCSESTMYRLLRETHGQVRERRRQATHPPRVKPELVAHGPNQCWSWDITRLAGPAKWTYYYLYSIIDIYSRYTVGWMVATREDKKLAERLLGDTIAKQNIDRHQLTIHADRGSSMASKPVAFLLADLGVTKSHSRPHCSNDNPFSEAQFKTLKYRPDFPERFGSVEDARAFCDLLPLVQPRPSSFRNRDAYPVRRPPRPRRHHPPGPGRHPGRRLRQQPRKIRPQAPRAPQPARHGLDQPTRTRSTDPINKLTQQG
jgi:putative transposase